MKAEVVVVGGGLAGCATAITMARGGRDVVMVEREAAAQHKVCGEFLSAEALGYLRALGMDVALLGALPIERVRMGGVEAQLPFAAMSLTRKRLDEEMLRVAAEAGVRVMRGCSVEEMGRAAGTQDWLLRLGGGGGVLAASAVFLATGKHDLRGWKRPPGQQDGLVAMKMYWRLTTAQARALDGCVELLTYRGGYAGLQPVEDGCANLCCLVERAELQRLGGRWEAFLAAMLEQSTHLRERLEGAEPLLDKPLAVAAIPYGLVREPVAGVWCVGDQAAVIPSFTGDGMSIALHTGVLAGKMYIEGHLPEDFQRRVKRELLRQVGLATWLSRGLVARPAMMMAAARVWPGMLRVVASGTRISQSAILG